MTSSYLVSGFSTCKTEKWTQKLQSGSGPLQSKGLLASPQDQDPDSFAVFRVEFCLLLGLTPFLLNFPLSEPQVGSGQADSCSASQRALMRTRGPNLPLVLWLSVTLTHTKCCSTSGLADAFTVIRFLSTAVNTITGNMFEGLIDSKSHPSKWGGWPLTRVSGLPLCAHPGPHYHGNKDTLPCPPALDPKALTSGQINSACKEQTVHIKGSHIKNRSTFTRKVVSEWSYSQSLP